MLTRKIDKVGRICIPKRYLEPLEINRRQEMEITIEYGKIYVKKFSKDNLKERQYVGIVRRIDSINRIIIPVEFLKLLNIGYEKYVLLDLKDDKIQISLIES